MERISYYTEEGLKKLKEEFHRLTTKERLYVAAQLKEAADKGDLSENAEYDEAKRAQESLETKISKLAHTLANARAIDEADIDTSQVSILSKAKVKNKQTGHTQAFILVAAEEVDLKVGKISVDSPIGQGLLGKKVGEVASVAAPSGQLEFEVVDIS